MIMIRNCNCCQCLQMYLEDFRTNKTCFRKEHSLLLQVGKQMFEKIESNQLKSVFDIFLNFVNHQLQSLILHKDF